MLKNEEIFQNEKCLKIQEVRKMEKKFQGETIIPYKRNREMLKNKKSVHIKKFPSWKVNNIFKKLRI